MLIPLYVGQDEPVKPDQMIANPPPNPTDKNLLAQRMLELYNTERKSHGLPPLVLSVEASAVASERSAALVLNKELPPDTTLEDMLARRGVVAWRVYQSSAYLNSVDESAWHSLLSPMHRRAILRINASLVGIGFAQKDEHQHAAIEYIVTPVPPLDVKAKKAALFEAVNTLRTAKGKPAFKGLPRAELALDEFAKAVCVGEIPYGELDPLYKLLKKHKVRYARAQTLYVKSRYFTRKELKKQGYQGLVEADRGELAVGVCRGDFPDLPRGEYVVFLIIQPSRAKAPAR